MAGKVTSARGAVGSRFFADIILHEDVAKIKPEAMIVHEGQLSPVLENQKIAIVVSRFNELVTSKLLQGALDALRRQGGDENMVEVAWVPGAFELPVAAKGFLSTGRFGAVVCLGCVIKGDTDHFDYVCGPTASGIMQVAASTGFPIIFGVLTTHTLEQALDRAGAKSGNKGAEAMVTALEMMSLLRKIKA